MDIRGPYSKGGIMIGLHKQDDKYMNKNKGKIGYNVSPEDGSMSRNM
jgi:hypothetical protein